MDLALAIARSGLEAHHKNIEVISNNLANANTTAFKRNRPEFEELPYNIIKQPDSETSETTTSTSGLIIGTGTKLSNNKKIFTDGAQLPTDEPLDLAIKGPGFFKVLLPNGNEYAYTRAGSLQKNDTGQLILHNGYVVQPPITIPAGTVNINITEDGVVSGITPGTQVPTNFGTLDLTTFINPDGLTPVGQNLYMANDANDQGTANPPGTNGTGTLVQFALEGSNVSVVEEMVNLIEAQRAFEVTSKAVAAVDNMMQYLSRQA